MSYTPRLKEKYAQDIIPALTEKFGYKTVMRVPKLQKIVLSQGIGDAVADKKLANVTAKVTEMVNKLPPARGERGQGKQNKSEPKVTTTTVG